MTFKNDYRLWDDEYERTHWTPEELDASNTKVARIGEIIDAEQNGEISHDEAMIRHLMLDPDLFEVMLDDAYGDSVQVQRVQAWYNEAKARNYWKSLIDNAKQTAQTGRNLENVIELMNKALGILKAAVPTRA